MSDSLKHILLAAARQAVARGDNLRVDDLLVALLSAPLGARIAPTIHPVAHWPAVEPTTEMPANLHIYVDETLVAFDRKAERLFSVGANCVILGEYEPRHLAEAIGNVAATTQAPFARFGLDPKAWRQALSANP